MTQQAADAAYCANVVRRHDPERWLTTLFAPEAVRSALLTLYAFNVEVARTAEQVREPLLGRIRLQWWRETIDAAYRGAARQDPIARSLSLIIESAKLERRCFERLIDARETDLDTGAISTLDDLLGYAEAASSTLVRLALQVLGRPDQDARSAGLAVALAGLMRAVDFHAAQGRVYLPKNMLDVQGLLAADLRGPSGGHPLRQVIGEVCKIAEGHVEACNPVERQAWPALAPARLARTSLRHLRAVGYDPAKVHISPLSKQISLLTGSLLGRI